MTLQTYPTGYSIGHPKAPGAISVQHESEEMFCISDASGDMRLTLEQIRHLYEIALHIVGRQTE